MNNAWKDREEILSCSIPGFHQYILTQPPRLNRVSQDLCAMVGCPEAELLQEDQDHYAALVHPADRPRYQELLNRARTTGTRQTAEYRLVKQDGTVLYVNDTLTPRRDSGGTLVGDSVLTDITRVKEENASLKLLNETVPCGIMKYSCEKQPRVTYINKRMMELLRIPPIQEEGELDYQELYTDNIFLMIPMEERRRFALYLNRVHSAGGPIAGEMSLLRCDGTRAYIFGWVTKCVNEQGEEEFQSVCMDVTERHQVQKANETRRYLKALSEVYDKIFEYDLSSNTVNASTATIPPSSSTWRTSLCRWTTPPSDGSPAR